MGNAPPSQQMTLDANIVIAYLGGDQHVIKTLCAWQAQGRTLFLSTVAEAEILSFSGFTAEELRATEEFIEDCFTPILFDRAVARIAANVRRDVKVKFPDAAIAATALFTHTPLATRNVRDFKNIPNLQLLYI